MPSDRAAPLMREKLAVGELPAPPLCIHCRVITEPGAPKPQKLLVIDQVAGWASRLPTSAQPRCAARALTFVNQITCQCEQKASQEAQVLSDA
jgi:hypothetical protein